MIDDIKTRVIQEARYIIKTGDTVREAGKKFCVGKSTVHKDMAERLFYIDKRLYKKVQKVFKVNLEERHIRGGEATKKKYMNLKSLDKYF